MRWPRDQTGSDIAQSLGISIDAARKRYRRLLDRIREDYVGSEDVPSETHATQEGRFETSDERPPRTSLDPAGGTE